MRLMPMRPVELIRCGKQNLRHFADPFRTDVQLDGASVASPAWGASLRQAAETAALSLGKPSCLVLAKSGLRQCAAERIERVLKACRQPFAL